jgi:hypothetical protein
VRICGYFFKPKGVRDQKSLGITAVGYSHHFSSMKYVLYALKPFKFFEFTTELHYVKPICGMIFCLSFSLSAQLF